MTAMFIRTVKARGGRGEKHEYVRLVENYRENGRAKQRVVLNLGRKDLLAPHLDSLVRILGGESSGGWVRASEVEPDEAACWGTVLVARHLWHELGLESILGRGDKGRLADGASLGERAFVLVANRLCSPGSEHHLASWLDTDYVCDRTGQRWLPPWEEHGRVQVNLTWLQRWYRTLDKLLERKEEVEEALFFRLRDLFSLPAELVFYDLTSTYFEGEGPAELGRHGYSRDGKPHNEQVQIGVVMVNGWPIAHHVFPGNWHDADTVPGIIDDLQKRFGLKRVVFVGDRGMVTSDNLEMLRERRQGYLVGLQRRRREDVYRIIMKATGPWQECPQKEEVNGDAARTLVQEVAGDQPGVRVFVVHSEERLAYERAMRERAMERTYFEHPDLEREKAYEGKYLIQTEEQDLAPVEAVSAYKELSEVERAFRCLKDVIEMRPIYHRDDKRVRGHIFVAVLAFLLKQALQKKLKAAGSKLSGEAALEALRTIHVVRMQVGPKLKQGVTGGSNRAREALSALGITNTAPPQAS